MIVANGHDLAVQRVFLAVQGLELLAVLGKADGEVAALDLVGIIDVQRAAEVHHHIVGDVHQRRDRAQPHRLQPVLQPARGGGVLHIAEMPADHDGAGIHGIRREVAAPDDRARIAAVALGGVQLAQRAEAGRRQVTGHATHAQAIGAVRRDGDVDQRVVEPGIFREGETQRRIFGKLNDAIMLVRQAKLAFRDQHAVGVLAADRALFQVDAGAGDMAADRGEHALHAGARVRRATDHLHDFLAGIDLADPQPVGIGMLLSGDDMGDSEGGEGGGAILHAFDLKADHGERADDLLQRGIGVEMLLQPGQGEFHRASPPVSVGTSNGTKP